MVENRSIRYGKAESTRRYLVDRVRQQTERRALEQARRVPWKRLAEAAEEYTDWQVFTLWLRAVVEAAGSIPPMVAQEMESRTPQLLGRIRPDVEAAVKNGNGAGRQDLAGCQLMGGDEHLYRREAGRLVGCRPLFSSMSLRSMKAWSHWEDIDKAVARCHAEHFPNYAQWQCEVAAVARLSNPDSTAQQVLDSVRAYLRRNGTSFSTAFRT
jgi:hypothetical protein